MAGSTTLTRFLSTNEVPNYVEVAILRAEIDELRDRISRLEEQVRHRRGALSVVRRVPGEILGEIFIHALPLGPLTRQHRQSLIHFNLVCKNWREAALMCHQLWSRVHVVGDEISFLPIRSWMARSGVVPTKLEVVMPAKKVRWEESEQEEGEDEEDEEDEDEGDGDEGDEEEDEGHEQAGREHKDMEAQEDVLVQLLKHGVPLDDLGIKFSDTEGLECLLDSLGNSDASSDKPRPWDSIKSLSLSFENDCQPENPNTLKSLLLRLPKTITSFELCLPNNYTLSIEEPMSMEPVLQLPQKFAEKLTAFSISCEWGVQHMFRLLEHCANLEVLTLDFLSMDSQWMAEQYAEATGALKVNLPKLHTLRLRQSPPDIISVLWYLQAPVLVNLDFEFDDEGGYLDFGGEFLAFLTTESNCAPTLKSLRIAGIQWDAIDICDTLDELPALTHLALEGVCFDEDEDDILQNLEERCKPSTSHRHLDQPAPFLPNLKVLELIGIVGQKNFHHLVGFISSREQLFRTGAWSSKSFGSDGRLKALTVTCNKRLSPLDLDSRERKKLKRSGMVLNVFPRSTWP